MSKKKYADLHIGDKCGRWEIIDYAEPKVYASGIHKRWLCRCTCGSGIERMVDDLRLKNGGSLSCGCVQKESILKQRGSIRKQSFYDWCHKNNHMDWLNWWDYDLNTLSPQEVSYCSHNSFYFKCNRGLHESSSYKLSTVIRSPKIRCRKCNSFAQNLIDKFGENALDLYWDYYKNVDDPWEISHSAKEATVWMKCINTDYHGSYEVLRTDALNTGCPYCAKRRIHPRDSFGQFMIDKYGEKEFYKIWDWDKNDIDPFSIAPSSGKNKVWLKCNKVGYHPSSFVSPNNIKLKDNYCSYCGNAKICKEESLGSCEPQALLYWSKANLLTPYDYGTHSNLSVFWKCPTKQHGDYKRRINDAVRCEFRCPECTAQSTTSMLQNKVSQYLTNEHHFNVLHENYCNLKPRNPKTGHLLFYDNEIPNLKLIIEVHGAQHYKITGFSELVAKYNNITPEEAFNEAKARDDYKKQYALDCGYDYLEIPYYTETDDDYKKIIDEKIFHIIQKQTMQEINTT